MGDLDVLTDPTYFGDDGDDESRAVAGIVSPSPASALVPPPPDIAPRTAISRSDDAADRLYRGTAATRYRKKLGYTARPSTIQRNKHASRWRLRYLDRDTCTGESAGATVAASTETPTCLNWHRPWRGKNSNPRPRRKSGRFPSVCALGARPGAAGKRNASAPTRRTACDPAGESHAGL